MTPLASLFPSRTAWLAHDWPERIVVDGGSLDRLPVSSSLPSSPSSASELRRACAYAQGPDATGRHVREEIEPARIVEAYESGRTIYLHDVQLPPIAPWLESLSRELDVPLGTIGTNLFLSPTGAGTSMHHDDTEAIVIQLAGRKRWSIAPNRERFAPGTRCARAADVIEDLAEHELVPGSTMFLPRGTWHATSTLADSVHLDLVIRAPTWADVVVEQIRTSLLRHEAWRAPVIGLASRRAELAAMLERLAADVEL